MNADKTKLSITGQSTLLRWWRGRKQRRSSEHDSNDSLRFGYASLPERLARFLTKHPQWKGPRYLRANAWRGDLLNITGGLAAIARANQPMASGVRAMLAEEKPKRMPRCLRNMKEVTTALIVGVLFAIFLMILWYSLFSLGEYIVSNGVNDSYDFFYGVFHILPLIPIIQLSAVLYSILRWSGSGAPTREAVLAAMCLNLERGTPLSDVFRQLSRFFPTRYVDLAATGESTGSLAECLSQLESEASQGLLESGRNRGVRAYLLLVGIVALVAAIYIADTLGLVYVEIYKDFGLLETPSWTLNLVIDYYPSFKYRNMATVIETSNAQSALASATNRLAFLPFIGVIVFVFISLRHPRRRAAFSRLTLRLPWVGYTNNLRSLRHAALLLAPELDAGIPLPEAVGHVCAADIHPAHRRVFERVRARLMQGDTMTDTLRHAGDAVPPGFLHFVALGESSGQLPESLRQVAQLYGPVVRARESISRTLLLCAGVLAVSSLVYVVVAGVFSANVAIVDACINAL